MANRGGRVGYDAIEWFNGGLFDDGGALPLEAAEIRTVLNAAEQDWSNIDPSILGTLFERGLDPSKRSQLGAHYTDPEKIMMIVNPVIIEPLTREWRTSERKSRRSMQRPRRPDRHAQNRKRRPQASTGNQGSAKKTLFVGPNAHGVLFKSASEIIACSILPAVPATSSTWD